MAKVRLAVIEGPCLVRGQCTFTFLLTYEVLMGIPMENKPNINNKISSKKHFLIALVKFSEDFRIAYFATRIFFLLLSRRRKPSYFKVKSDTQVRCPRWLRTSQLYPIGKRIHYIESVTILKLPRPGTLKV